MAVKLVYWFEEGGEEHRAILGGKGAGLAEMTRIGLPVPQGFTITTQAVRLITNQARNSRSLSNKT